jgi:multiple sugar transport system permease protein
LKGEISLTSPKAIAKSRPRRLVIRETVTSYLFLLPFLLFFIVFVIYPMFMCVYTSFFDATMGREDIFIGLENYKRLFADEVFWIALKNTMVIVLVSVPITCIFSLWVASVISKMPVAATSLCVFLFRKVLTSSFPGISW